MKYNNIKLIDTRLARKIIFYRDIYLLAIPGIILIIIFNYYPLYFLQVAFKKYNAIKGLSASPWVGLYNFKRLFHSLFFLRALRNTLILSAMYKSIGFVIPIILALLLNELRVYWFKRTAQTIIYLPHFISWVIVGGLFVQILSPRTGIVNQILRMFGIKPIFFMASKEWFRWILLVSYVWKESGWKTIIYLAAMTNVNPELYEAAEIDGANRFKQALHVTLPAISLTIVVVFVLSLSRVLSLFEQVLIMYNPIVAEVSETIDTYVYKLGVSQGQIDFATAVGLFKNIVSLVLVLAANKLAEKLQGAKAF